MAVKNIKVNKDWLYYQVNASTLRKIIQDGEIKSKYQLLSLEEKISELSSSTWSGLFYISLMKKTNYLESNGYDFKIFGEHALICSGIRTKKTHFVEPDVMEDMNLIKALPFPIRFSEWQGEYQVRKNIGLDKVVGIKLPEMGCMESRLDKMMGIDAIVDVLDSNNCSLPFIDVENHKEIDKSDVKQYLLNR